METGGAVDSKTGDELVWSGGKKQVVGNGEVDKSNHVSAWVRLDRGNRWAVGVDESLGKLLAGNEVGRADSDIEVVEGFWRESERGLGNSARGEKGRSGEESLVLHFGESVLLCEDDLKRET